MDKMKSHFFFLSFFIVREAVSLVLERKESQFPFHDNFNYIVIVTMIVPIQAKQLVEHVGFNSLRK